MTDIIDIQAVYKQAATEVGCNKFGSAKAAKKALGLLVKNHDGADLVEQARHFAKDAQYQRRSYRRGVFYSWPYWNDGPLKDLDLGDPWPASRWPQDYLAFCIIQAHLKGEIDVFEPEGMKNETRHRNVF